MNWTGLAQFKNQESQVLYFNKPRQEQQVHDWTMHSYVHGLIRMQKILLKDAKQVSVLSVFNFANAKTVAKQTLGGSFNSYCARRPKTQRRNRRQTNEKSAQNRWCYRESLGQNLKRTNTAVLSPWKLAMLSHISRKINTKSCSRLQRRETQ